MLSVSPGKKREEQPDNSHQTSD